MPDPLEILYRDDNFVAVNKPCGLLVHRSDIDKHETRFAMQMLRDQLGVRVYPLHRLDKPTSGVLLFSLSQEVARLSMPLFAGHQVKKCYMAVVRGYAPEQVTIDYPLKEKLDKISDVQADRNKPAQQAISVCNRLATVEVPVAVGRYSSARFSLLNIQPSTGRKHQIRRHMKHIHHPIIGDTTYGDGKQNQFFRNQYQIHRLLLHAWRVSFIHPLSAKPITITSGLDNGFSKVIDVLGWRQSLSNLIY